MAWPDPNSCDERCAMCGALIVKGEADHEDERPAQSVLWAVAALLRDHPGAAEAMLLYSIPGMQVREIADWMTARAQANRKGTVTPPRVIALLKKADMLVPGWRNYEHTPIPVPPIS